MQSGGNGNGVNGKVSPRARPQALLGRRGHRLSVHLVTLLIERGHEVVAIHRSGGEVAGVPVAAVDVLDADAVAESARADASFLARSR
jgi:putative NADH-flavin reductase